MGWQNSSLRLLPCIRALGPLEGRQPAHLQPAAAGGAARSSGGSSRVRSWGRTRCLVPQHCAAERQQLWLQRHRPVGGRYGGSQGGRSRKHAATAAAKAPQPGQRHRWLLLCTHARASCQLRHPAHLMRCPGRGWASCHLWSRSRPWALQDQQQAGVTGVRILLGQGVAG